MTITINDINKLRHQTGAGMMACKAALTESKGDFEKAIAFLRKQGAQIAASRATKTNKEGTVFVGTNSPEDDYGVSFSLQCETDFVAKNASFQNLGKSILDLAIRYKPLNTAQLLSLKTQEGVSVAEQIDTLISKMSEKITIERYATLVSDTVVSYAHAGGRLGVLMGLTGVQGTQVKEAGRNIAMQIAAMDPLAVDERGIDAKTIAREREIASVRARKEGKPEFILDKIVQGKLNKFFKENVLLHQSFVKDNGLTVAQYLSHVSPELTITGFERMTII